MIGNREQVIFDCKLMLEMLGDHTKLDAQIKKVSEEIELVIGLISACALENAENAQEQDAFNKQHHSLVARNQKAMARLDKLNAERMNRQNRNRDLHGFFDVLTASPLVLDTWDEQL